MKLSRFLLFGVALLIGAAAVATTAVLPPLNVATEAILPSLAAVLVFAGVSAIAWVVVNYLASLVILGHGLDLRPARFVPPQTGAPEVTAFG